MRRVLTTVGYGVYAALDLIEDAALPGAMGTMDFNSSCTICASP